jgi:polyhydroxyalkanoate synthesis regulator phasin
MSTSNAEMYGRRARDAADHADVGLNVKRAIDELVKEIKELEARVAKLERKAR